MNILKQLSLTVPSLLEYMLLKYYNTKDIQIINDALDIKVFLKDRDIIDRLIQEINLVMVTGIENEKRYIEPNTSIISKIKNISHLASYKGLEVFIADGKLYRIINKTWDYTDECWKKITDEQPILISNEENITCVICLENMIVVVASGLIHMYYYKTKINHNNSLIYSFIKHTIYKSAKNVTHITGFKNDIYYVSNDQMYYIMFYGSRFDKPCVVLGTSKYKDITCIKRNKNNFFFISDLKLYKRTISEYNARQIGKYDNVTHVECSETCFVFISNGNLYVSKVNLSMSIQRFCGLRFLNNDPIHMLLRSGGHVTDVSCSDDQIMFIDNERLHGVGSGTVLDIVDGVELKEDFFVSKPCLIPMYSKVSHVACNGYDTIFVCK